MKAFRAWNCCAGVCLILLLIVSQANSATTAKSTPPSIPVSILGCPQGPPPRGPVPQYGGTLKIIYLRNVNNMGAPWKTTSPSDRALGRFAIENLIGLDTKGEPIPQLATSWKSNVADKTITFTLRQGVKFQDGTDFNAEAAKWNLETYRKGGKSDLKLVTSVDVIDAYHIRMTLSAWDPLFVQSLSFIGAGDMISPAAAQKFGDAIELNPVGTGPFKFVSFEPNVSLKYQRFDGYWQKGLPYLDAVQVSFVADSVVALASFTRGEGDYLDFVAPKDAKVLKAKGHTILSNTSTISTLIGDSSNPGSPFADIRVRQAMAYAIENKDIVDSVFEGFNPPTKQIAVKGATAYDPTITGYPYNPAKARELLAAAGYSTAKPLNTEIVYGNNPQTTDLYTFVQSYLSKVGINLKLSPTDPATYTKLRATGWTNHLLEGGISYNGIETKYSNSLSVNLSPDRNSFVSVALPDDYVSIYRKMLVENDPAKRETYYRQLNKMAIDKYCMVVPLMASNKLFACSPKLHDFGMCSVAVCEFLPERAWLSK